MSISLNRLKRRTVPVSWLLLALLTIFPMAQHASAGIVLCIGADGHIDFEDGLVSDCAKVGDSEEAEKHYASPVTQSNVEDVEDCGPCVDVSILGNPLDGQRLSKIDASPLISIPIGTIDNFFETEEIRSPLNSYLAPKSFSNFYYPLRTIALLI